MSGMPIAFAPTVVSEAAPSVTIHDSTMAPPATEVVVTDKGKSRKKRKLQKKNTDEDVPSKKHTTEVPSSVSIVGSVFGRLAEKHVTETELKAWRERTRVQQRAAIKRATTELFLHNLTCEDNLEAHEARLQELESENDTFKNNIKELKNKVKQLEQERSVVDSSMSSLKAAHSKLEEALKAKDASLASLTDTTTKLSNENKELKANQAKGWAEEKKRVEGAAYQEGFRGYLKTFMAADPDYDWTSTFGEDMGKWMADFAVMEAKAIAEKKLLLEEEREKEKWATSTANTEIPADEDEDVA